jgi:hypothetical protein
MATNSSSNLGRWVGLVYCTFAAGFGGWRGADFWTWPSALAVFLPPVAFAVLLTIRTSIRNPPRTAVALLVMAVIAGSLLGGMGLLIAWLASAVAGPWADPVVRTAVPAAVMAAVYAFGLFLQRKPGPADRPA